MDGFGGGLGLGFGGGLQTVGGGSNVWGRSLVLPWSAATVPMAASLSETDTLVGTLGGHSTGVGSGWFKRRRDVGRRRRRWAHD
jgi:hypothetical protein